MTSGKHLLAIGNPGREFDIETTANLQFSADRLFKDETAEWVCTPIIPAKAPEYGWNVLYDGMTRKFNANNRSRP